MAIVRTTSSIHTFVGLSTDTKTTADVPAGSRFWETDTGIWFLFNGTAWTAEIASVQGVVASDAVADGNPVAIGGVVDDTSPAAAAEGDARAIRVSPEGDLLLGGNAEVSLLGSAARTATVSAGDQTNLNARGVIITLDVSAISATPSITLAVEHKDSVAGKYEKLLDGAAVTAVGTHTYIVYPGADTTAREDVVEVSGWPIGRTWRITVTHADSDSITYSVAASYVR